MDRGFPNALFWCSFGYVNSNSEKLWIKAYSSLDEAQRRWFAAQRAVEIGRGGITYVRRLTGLSRTTIAKGVEELQSRKPLCVGRIRASGGGRKPKKYETRLIADLKGLLEETTAGDPMRILLWTTKSVRNLAEALQFKGHDVSYRTVATMLHEMDYCLQGNRKVLVDADHPDRDSQFRYIHQTVKNYVRDGWPVISVDTKKKELVGNFKNAGRVWGEKGKRRQVNAYDFRHLADGTAVPYGAYDESRNEGFVNVGISRDTAEFAVESIRQWWQRVGRHHYPKTLRLLICADGGGSNGSRNRLWKYCLQEFADTTRLVVSVCHYPPGTSKWNKIEHRMFSFISSNWKGRPLVDYETVVNLISGTKTRKGLKIEARLDPYAYEAGIKVTDEEMEALSIQPSKTNPKWNYSLTPRV